MLCEICKTQFKCINGEFICEEGHVSHTKLEVADDLHFSSRSQKEKTEKKSSIFSEYSFKYKTLLVHNMLFNELITYLNCSSTKFIDYYMNFFAGNRDVISSPIKMNLGYIFFLGYLTKRFELERSSNLYFYSQYVMEVEKFDYIGKTVKIKGLLDMKKIRNKNLGIYKKPIHWINKYKITDILGTSKYPVNKHHRQIYRETSLSHPLIEYHKSFFRQEFDCSENLLLKYFYKVLEIYHITPHENVLKYFKKFLLLRNLSNKMFYPEDEISMFLYIYDHYEKLEIDIKIALKNINLFLNNTNYNENEEVDLDKVKFIDLITLLTHSSHSQFYKRLISVMSCKEFLATNNIFVVNKTKIQYYREYRWKAFRIYIDRIKRLLADKINFKIKKKYIEDDRI